MSVDYTIENPDDLPADIIQQATEIALGMDELASLESWHGATSGGFTTSGGFDVWGSQSLGGNGVAQSGNRTQGNYLFERNAYRSPANIIEELRLAGALVNDDDIVGNICDLTESLAIQRMRWETTNEDEEDVWNQIARDLDMDARLREMWRELFTYSQFYVAMFWGTKTYTVRGKNNKTGVKRRKSFTLEVPIAMSLLDPTKVMPVGSLMFGKERLAWVATKTEVQAYKKDEVLKQLVEAKYTPTEEERQRFSELKIDPDSLLLLREENVWRHTLPRPAYKRWSEVRLKSVFPLIDLKRNLRAMERAHLVGATNFILVVRKGSDKIPARQNEIDNLDKNVRRLARVPVLVGDHRLSVEIVTPKLDLTLNNEKWATLDNRIGSRLLLSLSTGGDKAVRDTTLTVGRAVARGLESRRHLISRALEKHVVDRVLDRNPGLEERPSHTFVPHHIALDWDANFVNLLIKLRDRGDLSRESVLEEADFDQSVEYRRRSVEDEQYDDVFLLPTIVPYSGEGQQPGKSSGGADNKTGKAPAGRPKGSSTGSSSK